MNSPSAHTVIEITVVLPNGKLYFKISNPLIQGNLIFLNFTGKNHDSKWLIHHLLLSDSRKFNEMRVKLILVYFINPDVICMLLLLIAAACSTDQCNV